MCIRMSNFILCKEKSLSWNALLDDTVTAESHTMFISINFKDLLYSIRHTVAHGSFYLPVLYVLFLMEFIVIIIVHSIIR